MRSPFFAVRRAAGILLALAVLALCLPCAAEQACPLIGRWTFPGLDEVVLRVEADGTAVYQGQAFDWTDRGDALELVSADGTVTVLRYLSDESGMWIWPATVYARTEGDAGSGLTGAWSVPETPRVSFVFRADGTFVEDTVFTGTWTADEEAGTFRLDYGGMFDPVVCRWSIEGDRLTVEYPWQLVPCL